MKFEKLAGLIDSALETKPPKALESLCDEYYQPYYYLLYLLADYFSPGLAVELGVEKGRGCFAMAMADIWVWGVDHIRNVEIARVETIFPNFVFVEKSSLPVPDEIGKPISLLHIDTEHSYAMAQSEFEAYQPYLKPGAVVLFDDLNAVEGEVLDYFLSLTAYSKIQEDRLHPSCGYGVLIYE